jgi:hypothetical protein
MESNEGGNYEDIKRDKKNLRNFKNILFQYSTVSNVSFQKF